MERERDPGRKLEKEKIHQIVIESKQTLGQGKGNRNRRTMNAGGWEILWYYSDILMFMVSRELTISPQVSGIINTRVWRGWDINEELYFFARWLFYLMSLVHYRFSQVSVCPASSLGVSALYWSCLLRKTNWDKIQIESFHYKPTNKLFKFLQQPENTTREGEVPGFSLLGLCKGCHCQTCFHQYVDNGGQNRPKKDVVAKEKKHRKKEFQEQGFPSKLSNPSYQSESWFMDIARFRKNYFWDCHADRINL